MGKKTFGLLGISIILFSGFIANGCKSLELETKNEEEVKYKDSKLNEREIRVVKAESKDKKESSKEEKSRQNTLVIANFDNCEKPNKIGVDFGAWDKNPDDFTQSAMDSFISNVKRGKDGCSVQIAYDVISPNVAYNGFWMGLNGLDASEYNKLNFWIKGDAKRGFTKVFKVELKNSKGEVGKTYVTGLTKEWQKITLPLSKFKQLTDFTTLKEFVIVFEDRIATAKKGAIYIDDMHLSK